MQAEALTSTIRPVFKYVYLMTFFALLAGFFHPVVKGIGFDANILGIFILFVGVAGGALLYKAPDTKYPEVLMGMGFILIGISFWFIFLLAGRLG